MNKELENELQKVCVKIERIDSLLRKKYAQESEINEKIVIACYKCGWGLDVLLQCKDSIYVKIKRLLRLRESTLAAKLDIETGFY